ncbi:unnamed protein product [Rangifer tarandus platyrhynchus]|uniref:Uncharacterized protein n=1 Tax=Rangifer tarandus platyrhynchus TaxID=3082113 RepID=A0ABN8Z6L1_RANTA|nr:unnamed protein product [Rangifer tarandus platyrhynchus]CAI9687935.1 unnamed protein product [Rangifer tarandus platyrhynchus]
MACRSCRPVVGTWALHYGAAGTTDPNKPKRNSTRLGTRGSARPRRLCPQNKQELGSNPGHRVTLAVSRAAGLSFLVFATPRQEASEAEQKRGFLESPRCGPDFREPAPATLGGLYRLNPRPLFDPGPAGPWLSASTPPRLGPRPGRLTSALTSPLARPGLTSAPVSALTAPAQPRAGPQLGPRPRLGPSPASPSEAAAQMLLGGRRWFRSHKMAALTAATSVPVAAGDAGERGSPLRGPTHSPFAVRTRRLCAGARPAQAESGCACARLSVICPGGVSSQAHLADAETESQAGSVVPGRPFWMPAPVSSLSPGDRRDPRCPVRGRGATWRSKSQAQMEKASSSTGGAGQGTVLPWGAT